MFDRILHLAAHTPGLTELTVIFLTDGQATEPLDDKLMSMKDIFETNIGLRAKWLTIGLGRHHDAAFLLKVVDVGNEPGNFIFVDTEVDRWEEGLGQSLTDSLDMAIDAGANLLKC